MVSGESSAIEAVESPATLPSLTAELQALGLRRDGATIVHSSLSALGWVAGGAQAVVEALLAAAGPEATIVMPTHSGELSDPALWEHPPVPEHWWPTIRDTMPAYDPAITPTRMMGAVVDVSTSRSSRCSMRAATRCGAKSAP